LVGGWYARWGRGPADGVPTAWGAGQVNRARIKTKRERAAFPSTNSVKVWLIGCSEFKEVVYG
jgi:hypothetical protein